MSNANRSLQLMLLVPAVFLVNAPRLGAQTPPEPLPNFMGRIVTIVEPERDEYFPKGPASVCLQAPPERQCYTAPKDFGNNPQVQVIEVETNEPALFFSVASGGVSGWLWHFALLRPGTGKNLENLFLSDTTVSNLNQHSFWKEPSISDAPIFVTADYVWGPDESHYEPHRYTISAYVWRFSTMAEGKFYSLDDRFMTDRFYDLDANDDVLAAEKPEILGRLRRVKAIRESQQPTPR